MRQLCALWVRIEDFIEEVKEEAPSFIEGIIVFVVGIAFVAFILWSITGDLR
jgi:hypothetical protein